MIKILCLTDFSAAATNAAGYAAWLTHKTGASLTLLHVLQTQVLEERIISKEQLLVLEQQTLQLRKELEQLKDSLLLIYPDLKESRLTRIGCRIAVGTLADVVQQHCHESHFDLVVVGTTGGTGDTLDDLLVGSNTIDLFNRLDAPVLAVPKKYQSRQISTMLFATDYQAKDELVAQRVIELAQPLEAQVYIVHVSPKGSNGREEQLIAFAKLVMRHGAYDRLHFNRISHNNVETSLISYANEIGADMLVLAGKPHSFFKTLLSQSLADQVACHTWIPLLVYPIKWKRASVPTYAADSQLSTLDL